MPQIFPSFFQIPSEFRWQSKLRRKIKPETARLQLAEIAIYRCPKTIATRAVLAITVALINYVREIVKNATHCEKTPTDSSTTR